MKSFNPDDLEYPWEDEEDMKSASLEMKKKFEERLKKNEKAREVYFKFPDFESFPVGVTEAPFKWEYLDGEYDMRFISGFIGIEQTSDGYIKPKIGWGIGQKTEPEKKEENEEEEE